MSDPTPIPIDQITARIAAAHQRLLRAIAPLTPEQMVAPVLGAGGWSAKDVLAHLEFWDRRLLHAIQPEHWPEASWAAGPAVEPTDEAHVRLLPPPIADIPYPDGWLEAVNTRIYTHNRDRDLADVLSAFDATGARLHAAVSTLPQRTVTDLDALLAPLGEPLSTMMIGAYEHYDEHAAELEAHRFA